jgi:predicted ribosome quality control (RQC) complex YloA/Tae2 family protein
MYFDALTLTAVADELRATILGGRVQRVLLPGPLSIGLEVYAQRQRYQLLASADPQVARVHLVRARLSRGVEQATPLLLLLRKYVLGGRIIAIDQPPLERILVLSIAKETARRNHLESQIPPEAIPSEDESAEDASVEDEEDDEQPPIAADPDQPPLQCELVIEPMDRRSNIILIDDDNLILDSVKRVTPEMSQRVILPRHVYELPPRQEKRNPQTATAAGMAALVESGARSLTRAIVGAYRGVSPQVAREAVYRALGHPDAELSAVLPMEELATHLRELFTPPWQPTLAVAEEQPQAYAPYLLTHRSGAAPQPGISVALETFYAARESVTAHRQRRERVQQQLTEARDRLQHQQRQLATELERAQHLEQQRWEGEMILGFMHTLSPGQQTLEVEGQTIKLDPERSPLEAAQARFRAVDKAKSALEGVPERLKATEQQLAGLEELLALLALTDVREQIDQIAQEAEEQGYIRPAQARAGAGRRGKPRTPRLKPLHLVSSDGFDIFVGRSSEQNAEVTFRIGQPDDIWLHVRTIPGGHVIVRSGGRDIPERTLQEAAGLAAYFSGVRHETAVDVDLSRRKGVRKVSGGPPGLVTYQAERTLRVAPLPPWAGQPGQRSE